MPKLKRERAIIKRRSAFFPLHRELAWQAGIMDGEGTITITRQIRKDRASPSFRPFVTVTNTNIDLIAPFVQKWGGCVYRSVDLRTEKKWSDSFSWYCPHTVVPIFLTSIMPYLRGKRKQAELVLEFLRTAKKFPRYIGSFTGKKRGGSAPLGDAEIKHRAKLMRAIQALNAKSKVCRAVVMGGDAKCDQQHPTS